MHCTPSTLQIVRTSVHFPHPDGPFKSNALWLPTLLLNLPVIQASVSCFVESGVIKTSPTLPGFSSELSDHMLLSVSWLEKTGGDIDGLGRGEGVSGLVGGGVKGGTGVGVATAVASFFNGGGAAHFLTDN